MHSHASGDSSQQPSSWEWWLALALASLGSVFGAYGQMVYDHQNPPDWSSILYHTLQLFVLHAPHLEGKLPLSLHWGRWFVTGAVLILARKGLVKVYRGDFLRYRVRWYSDHIVICGSGQLATQLLHQYLSQGQKVVVVGFGRNSEMAGVAEARGVPAIVAETVSPACLHKARVEHAKEVFAVSDSEEINIAVALAIRNLVKKQQLHKPLQCWMFVAGARLRQTFQQPGLFSKNVANYRVDVRGLDLFTLAARQALKTWPLDFKGIRETDATVAHLVLAGFGQMGQRLALQAARLGHFANFKTKKLKVTVMERPDSPNPDMFLKIYSAFPEVCDFKVIRTAPESLDAVEQLAELAPVLDDSAKNQGDSKDERVTFALCCDRGSDSARTESGMLEELEKDDPVNLSLAIDLAKKTDPKTSRLLVFQTRKAGLGALFSSEYLSEDVRSRVHAFGALEDIYSLDVLLHEPQDVIARALHQDYLNTQEETGHMPRSKPALFSWEELEEKYRDSNRRAADHIDVKLRSIGLEVKPLEGESLGFFDNDPRVELLAQMEHESWSADTLLQGYTYGRIRDEVSANKKHDCLLPWDSLSKDTKEWDRKQILAIPRALKRAGMGIYPAEK